MTNTFLIYIFSIFKKILNIFTKCPNAWLIQFPCFPLWFANLSLFVIHALICPFVPLSYLYTLTSCFSTHQFISEITQTAVCFFIYHYCSKMYLIVCMHCSTPFYHYLHLTTVPSFSLFSPCRPPLLLSLSSYLSPVAYEQTAKCEIIRFGKVTEIGGGAVVSVNAIF